MADITAAEALLLDTRPQRTKLYLSIYQPNTVLAAQVDDAGIPKGEREIDYDGVTSGSYLLIEGGMVMYVGAGAGANTKGRLRAKSATATTVTVAENAHIRWSDDDYFIIKNFYEITAIYPRIIQDPADADNTLWYKDWDIEYTNQNSMLGSFICMGPHHAGFLDSGQHQVFYTSTGTHSLQNDALTFSWWFQGATVTGSSSDVPGNIIYTSPGHYTTRLTVTNSSGTSDTSYRHVSIYDRPEDGVNNPILLWELVSFSGSVEQGGYTARVRIRESVSRTQIRDGYLVVIFAEDWYGDTKQSIGGNATGRQSIVFVGYILEGSIQYDYRQGSVEFDIGSPTEIMKMSEGFAISISDSSNPSGDAANDPNVPSGWVKLLNMNSRRAIYHYLRWHSTVLFCNDFEFIIDDPALQNFDSDRESLYHAVNSYLQLALVGNLVSDRQGKSFSELDQSSVAGGDLPARLDLFNLNKNKWMGQPVIDERIDAEVSMLEWGGVVYSGSTGTFLAMLSAAPGVTPNYRGGIDKRDNLSLVGQSQLNALTGDVYAYMNSRYPNIEYNLNSNFRNLDIAPKQYVSVSMAASDTPRGRAFVNKRFTVRGMNWRYDPRRELLLPSISVAEVTSGFNGSTVAIASVPPTDGGSGGADPPGGGFTIPPIIIPPIPIPIPSSLFINSRIIGVQQAFVGATPTNNFLTGLVFVAPFSGNYLLNIQLHMTFTGGTGNVQVFCMKNNTDDPNANNWSYASWGVLVDAVDSVHNTNALGRSFIADINGAQFVRVLLVNSYTGTITVASTSNNTSPVFSWVYLG